MDSSFCWCLIIVVGLVGHFVDGGGGSSPPVVVRGTVFINGSVGIAKTDANFICATLDWWPPEKCDYGTCSWGHASLLNLDLNNTILVNAVRAFWPLKIRLGGTLQDKVIYDVGASGKSCNSFVVNASEMFGFSQGCLPMARWDQLNKFFQRTRATVIFGLNALNGRVTLKDGSVGGPWNSSNAEALIRYTIDHRYRIHGWELGNELSGRGIGASIGADQYASDVASLHNMIHNLYRGSRVKPLVIAPGGFFDAAWYQELIIKSKRNLMDVITHHIYNLGPGVDEHLIEKILDPAYLDGEAKVFSDLQGILRSASTSTRAWVGEAGGAYNSGRNLVTNSFVFSFWYLDQLGMSSKFDTKAYCRQSLIGGNYGLLNTTTFQPNPDYYSALLWHRLMGRVVLSTTFSGTSSIRAYAHCAKNFRGITLLLINLSSNTTVQAVVTSESYKQTAEVTEVGRMPGAWRKGGQTREEYHLTAKDGNLHSHTVLLNGKALDVSQSGRIPAFNPIIVSEREPISIVPFSIVFARIPYIDPYPCRI
ncbi:heparanase-like protein 3 [Nymphaea colorata]|nr:heparanase-like protein 3 [Nymphaea colorata]